MKKILIIFFIFININLFGLSFENNNIFIDTVNTINQNKSVDITTKENGTIIFSYNDNSLLLNETSFYLFSQYVKISKELFQTVKQENIQFNYKRSLGLINTYDYQKMSFLFYTSKGKSYVTLIITPKSSFKSDRLSFNEEQIDKLTQTLNKAIQEYKNYISKIQTLNNIVAKAKNIY